MSTAFKARRPVGSIWLNQKIVRGSTRATDEILTETMTIRSRILSPRLWQRLQAVRITKKEPTQAYSIAANAVSNARQERVERESQSPEPAPQSFSIEDYRFKYPEFLPDPDQRRRNALREKLERMDMLARRTVIDIPLFFVGSVLAVTYSEKHAPDQVNKFIGICIQREGCGLRASFLLRNVVDGEGVEVLYDAYDPTIRSIQCLKLERRLDNQLLYLRDAPLEYSYVPFDMEPVTLPEGSPVPLNDTIVPLKPQPWRVKWEIMNMKGISGIVVNENRRSKAERHAKPWEKYDLMKIYRTTIPEEEQKEIYTEVQPELTSQQMQRQKIKTGILSRILKKPKKPLS